MRQVKRWRYYCDHCKKAGGAAGHIRRHEAGCTANPNRVCGICREGQADPKPLPELVGLCASMATTYHDPCTDYSCLQLDTAAVKALRQAADNCPACMLAAMRQSKAFPSRDDFNFKEELASTWADINSTKSQY